jgi:hypothetical protein
MTPNPETDAAWALWYEALREKVLPMAREGDYGSALRELDAFLSPEKPYAIRSDALGFKAQFRERLGDLKGAEEDLLTARALCGPSYGRYVHELGLGDICAKRGRPNDAAAWYQAALGTCLEAEGVSGGTALRKLLALRPEQTLTPSERTLCAKVVERSWGVLGLPDKPGAALESAIEAIEEGEANPRPGATSDQPG